MLISLILIFIQFSKVKIESVTFLGIKFSEAFGNPKSIYVALWILFFYFLTRYYQYFMQEGIHKLNDTFYQILNQEIIDISEKIIKNIHKKAEIFGYIDLKKHENKDLDISFQYPDENQNGKIKIEKTNISSTEIYYRKGKSFIKIIFNTSAFTDYVFPLILALLAVYYCFNNGEVSLINAIDNLRSA